MLKDDSYKTGTSSSPICDCGIERETVDHFRLRCSNYSEARKAMFDRSEALCLFSHHQFVCNLNEHLLLAPSDGSIITKTDDHYMQKHFLNFSLQWNEACNTNTVVLSSHNYICFIQLWFHIYGFHIANLHIVFTV